jgi:hypothetical protein
MIVRKEKFLSLKQGPLSVSEYMNKFMQLSRYAPEDVNTNAKSRDENGTGTRNGYRIRVRKRDEISDTETGILFVRTDTGTTRILNLEYG